MIGATRLVHLIWNTLPKIHFVQLTSNRQSPFCTEIASGGWANHFVHIQIIPNRHGEPHFVQVFFQHPVGVQNGTPSDFCVPFCGLWAGDGNFPTGVHYHHIYLNTRSHVAAKKSTVFHGNLWFDIILCGPQIAPVQNRKPSVFCRDMDRTKSYFRWLTWWPWFLQKCTRGVYRIRPFVGVEIVLVPCHYVQKSSKKLFMWALSVPGLVTTILYWKQ